MSPMAKREYLEAMRLRYLKATGRVEKSRILSEICATTGYDRKYVIRFLARRPKKGRKPKRTRGRKPLYQDSAVLKPLKAIWRTANLPCSKRLKAMIPIWLPGYESLYGTVEAEARSKLLSISAASIDRLMTPIRLQGGRGRSTTKPGGLLRAQIPIQTGQWEETRPGFIEADTVAHCGGSMAGQFVFTLDCVDIATGWSEQRALWNKGAEGVVKQMRAIERALPFPLLGFDADNGSEFINEQLVKHFLGRHKPVQFTRSRAYKKNDNAHIEQKNWTHVRQWMGYHRIDNPKAVELLNNLYENEWRLYHNFYGASMKLTAKQRDGAKVKKKYDTPKTPYQRVMESPTISDYSKRGLKEIFEHTNPFVLWRAINHKLREIHKLCYNPMNNNPSKEEIG